MKTAVIIAPGPSYLRTLTMKNVSHSVKEFAKHPGDKRRGHTAFKGVKKAKRSMNLFSSCRIL